MYVCKMESKWDLKLTKANLPILSCLGQEQWAKGIWWMLSWMMSKGSHQWQPIRPWSSSFLHVHSPAHSFLTDSVSYIKQAVAYAFAMSTTLFIDESSVMFVFRNWKSMVIFILQAMAGNQWQAKMDTHSNGGAELNKKKIYRGHKACVEWFSGTKFQFWT